MWIPINISSAGKHSGTSGKYLPVNLNSCGLMTCAGRRLPWIYLSICDGFFQIVVLRLAHTLGIQRVENALDLHQPRILRKSGGGFNVLYLWDLAFRLGLDLPVGWRKAKS